MVNPGTLLNIFQYQVKEHPQRLALKSRDLELTYAQLDEKSNRVAHHLISMGIKPGTLVPICLHRPFDMVIGIWGIIKRVVPMYR